MVPAPGTHSVTSPGLLLYRWVREAQEFNLLQIPVLSLLTPGPYILFSHCGGVSWAGLGGSSGMFWVLPSTLGPGHSSSPGSAAEYSAPGLGDRQARFTSGFQ